MDFETIKTIENENYVDVFSRMDHCFISGEGVLLTDITGKTYTDFLSGIAVNCLGYSDAGFKKTLKNQIDRLIHTSNYFYIEPQAKLIESLNRATGYDRVFVTNSGAEAVEAAMKLARKYFFEKGENRYKIITLKNSFHGRTLATLAATGQEKFHLPYMPPTAVFSYVPHNDIEALIQAADKETCAVMLEPVMGEGGVIPLEKDYYQSVRKFCNETGLLLIADEIQTGVGRCGTFLASEGYGVKPDIVVLAKALGNGLPIGAMLATEATAAAFKKGDHGSTFGGNQLVCAGAHYVVEKMLTTDIMAGNKKKGEYFLKKLTALNAFKSVKEVRGLGLMLGISFYPEYPAKDFQRKLLEKGFLAATAGENTLRFLPPYIIGKKHIDALTGALIGILS